MKTGLLFLTVHGRDGNGEQNPQSVLLIEALRQLKHGCLALILKSPADGEWIVRDTLVVPLYDVSRGVNRWSPRPNDTSLRTPNWARVLSSGSCVAVGQRCVAFPEVAERAARQIATLFSREFHRSEGWEYPWGPAPAQDRRSRRGQHNIRPRPESRSHLAL